MCGNIKKLRHPDRAATATEVTAAVRQYLRKISDMQQPSAENQAAFDEACQQVGAAVQRLLDGLKTKRAEALVKAQFVRVERP